MSRKKIAQLVLLVGVILVGGHFVQSCDHAPVAVEIHYLLGDPPICTGLEVIVEPGGPSGGPAVDHFQTTLISHDVRQATRLPPGENTLSITLVSGDARHTVKRTITVVEHAVIRLDLSHETFPVTRAPADIFIVDDDPLVTTSLGRLLELETPHRVTRFSSGAHALAVMQHGAPELIITDLSMPGMDGVELLRRARALRPDGARIILTGYADKDSAIRAINEAGIYMFVEKPWDNQSLLITVDNALKQVDLTRELGTTIGTLRTRNQELEHAVRELRDAQDRLVNAERLAAVGRLASGIAHEMGNQLSLLSFADLLRERYGDDPEARELIDPLIAVRRRLGSMLGSIRDYLRGNGAPSYAREVQPLLPIVDEAIDILRFEPARKTREIAREPNDPTVVAAVNREKILQVLINLLRNALQATREGGHIRAGVVRRGDRAIIEIADDGEGILPENLSQIWEPFFSTKGEAGTGLGLGICKRILEEHGGTIRVTSAPQAGATFTIELPLAS